MSQTLSLCVNVPLRTRSVVLPLFLSLSLSQSPALDQSLSHARVSSLCLACTFYSYHSLSLVHCRVCEITVRPSTCFGPLELKFLHKLLISKQRACSRICLRMSSPLSIADNFFCSLACHTRSESLSTSRARLFLMSRWLIRSLSLFHSLSRYCVPSLSLHRHPAYLSVFLSVCV